MPEYQVYFEGKVFVTADNEDEATDEAFNLLKRSRAEFQITAVHDVEGD